MLHGAIDDATNEVPAALFRLQEDAAGYLSVLHDTVHRYGCPAAVYTDRHTIFHAASEALPRPTPRRQPWTPAPDHPWKRMAAEAICRKQLRTAGVTFSLNR